MLNLSHGLHALNLSMLFRSRSVFYLVSHYLPFHHMVSSTVFYLFSNYVQAVRENSYKAEGLVYKL